MDPVTPKERLVEIDDELAFSRLVDGSVRVLCGDVVKDIPGNAWARLTAGLSREGASREAVTASMMLHDSRSTVEVRLDGEAIAQVVIRQVESTLTTPRPHVVRGSNGALPPGVIPHG